MPANVLHIPLPYRREVPEALLFILEHAGDGASILAYWRPLIAELSRELQERGLDDSACHDEILTFYMAVMRGLIDERMEFEASLLRDERSLFMMHNRYQ